MNFGIISRTNARLDLAVLAIAVHSALQVFCPANRHSKSDGLHRYRYYVYTVALVLPSMMAGLAFVNPGWAYLSQGAFCTLPIRPFWYLLALAWIPRYLIALTIISLAIAIYAHVGFEFRSYANTHESFKTPITTTNSRSSHFDRDTRASIATQRPTTNGAGAGLRSYVVRNEVSPPPRRTSTTTFDGDNIAMAQANTSTESSTQGLPVISLDFPGDAMFANRPPLFMIPSGFAMKSSKKREPSSPRHNSIQSAMDALTTKNATPFGCLQESVSSREPSPMSHAQRHMAHQRYRIHRQLRLMFIYPIVYTLMWVMPFVHHCLQYNNYFAAHPIWFIRLGATICMTSMGFVDCLIFSVREKPWRKMQTSGGTVWGSLAVWRSSRPSDAGLSPMSTERNQEIRTLERSMTESAGGSRIARIRGSVRRPFCPTK